MESPLGFVCPFSNRGLRWERLRASKGLSGYQTAGVKSPESPMADTRLLSVFLCKVINARDGMIHFPMLSWEMGTLRILDSAKELRCFVELSEHSVSFILIANRPCSWHVWNPGSPAAQVNPIFVCHEPTDEGIASDLPSRALRDAHADSVCIKEFKLLLQN
jgi:hypothetical protein